MPLKLQTNEKTSTEKKPWFWPTHSGLLNGHFVKHYFIVRIAYGCEIHFIINQVVNYEADIFIKTHCKNLLPDYVLITKQLILNILS